MPSQKRLQTVCHNIAHHAASSLSFVHPELPKACRAAGLKFTDVNLLAPHPYPAGLKRLKTLEMAFAAMKQRFETMLAAENFKPEDLSGMLLRFDFCGAKDDYWSNCHALMISEQGNEFREAVDSIGNAVKFDQSLGK